MTLYIKLFKSIKILSVLGAMGLAALDKVCVGMELPPEENTKNKFKLSLNNIPSIDSGSHSPNRYSPTTIKKTVVSGEKREKLDIEYSSLEVGEAIESHIKKSIQEQITNHAQKYPNLISRSGIINANRFLTELDCFVKSALLLRVDDGANNKNKTYYKSIKNICVDYMSFFLISNQKNNLNNESNIINDHLDNMCLEKFYNKDPFEIYKECHRHCDEQRNAFLIILTELNMYTVKANVRLEKELSCVAMVYGKKRLERFSCFINDHGNFITQCLRERTCFLNVLSDILFIRVLNSKTPEEFIGRTTDLLVETIAAFEDKIQPPHNGEIKEDINPKYFSFSGMISSDSALSSKTSLKKKNAREKIARPLERKVSRNNIQKPNSLQASFQDLSVLRSFNSKK